MDGTIQIGFAIVTTGGLLGPGGTSIAANPNAVAMTILLLLAALTMSGIAAWNSARGPVRHVPPGPALPKLRRRMSGPRDRRA